MVRTLTAEDPYSLTGTEELEEAGISTERHEARADDLGEDFDLDEVISSEYGPYESF